MKEGPPAGEGGGGDVRKQPEKSPSLSLEEPLLAGVFYFAKSIENLQISHVVETRLKAQRTLD
jgi:hypothetical protein